VDQPWIVPSHAARSSNSLDDLLHGATDARHAAKEPDARGDINDDGVFGAEGDHRREAHQSISDFQEHGVLSCRIAIIDQCVLRQRGDPASSHTEGNTRIARGGIGNNDFLPLEHDASMLRPRRPPRTEHLQR
jgi:hypothetical protein